MKLKFIIKFFRMLCYNFTDEEENYGDEILKMFEKEDHLLL